MVYARTKEGKIIRLEKEVSPCPGSIIIWTLEGFASLEIIDQSEDLEDLMDKKVVFVDNDYITFESMTVEELYESFIKDRENPARVYGAIWVEDKGLLFVTEIVEAKLELI